MSATNTPHETNPPPANHETTAPVSTSAPASSSSTPAPAPAPLLSLRHSLDFFTSAAPKLHSAVRELQEENKQLRAQNDELREQVEMLDGLSFFLREMSQTDLTYRQFLALKTKEVEEAKAKAKEGEQAKAKAQQTAAAGEVKPVVNKELPPVQVKGGPGTAVPSPAVPAAAAKPASSSLASSSAAASSASFNGSFSGFKPGFLQAAATKPTMVSSQRQQKTQITSPATAAASSSSSSASPPAEPVPASSSADTAALPSIPAPTLSPSLDSSVTPSPTPTRPSVRPSTKKRSQKRPAPKPAGADAHWTYTPATESNPPMRHLRPYDHDFTVFAKKRWVGRSVLEVLISDFKAPLATAETERSADEVAAASESYYRRALASGMIAINDSPTSPSYILRDRDHLRHTLHRHEPPVLDANPSSHQVSVVAQTDEVVVVDKPCSIPVHESGKYRHNTLLGFLYNQPPLVGQTLYPVHRLDKLTSGLVLLARSSAAAAQLAKIIQFQGEGGKDEGEKESESSNGTLAPSSSSSPLPATLPSKLVTKLYLARVSGRFPTTHFDLPGLSLHSDGRLCLSAPIRAVCLRQGIHTIDAAGGKPAISLFRFLSYDAASDSSVVEVQPLTGRTHQIRLHLQHMGYPILNDPVYGMGLFQGNSYGSIGEHPDPMVQSKQAPAYREGCAECEGKMYYKPEAAGQEGMRYCTGIYLHALSYSYTPSTTDAEDASSASSSSTSLLSRGFSFTTRTPEWAEPDFDVLKALGPKVKGSAKAVDIWRMKQEEKEKETLASKDAPAVSPSSSPSSSSPPPSSLRIRSSLPTDLPSITSIYSHAVLHLTGTFEEQAPSLEEMTRRREQVLQRKLPFLVATVREEGEGEGEEAPVRVVGFAYADLFRVRTAYRFTLEDSIYVHPDYSCRRGVGRALLTALLSLCERAGYRQMLAVIGDSQNHASLALHQRMGFTHVGCMRRVGVKFGRWLDVCIMQKEMGGGRQAEEQLPERDPQPCQMLTGTEEERG